MEGATTYCLIMANSKTTRSESYIRIVCTDNADSRKNRLLLRTEELMSITPEIKVPKYIPLQPGENILRVSDYPELKYGFYNCSCDDSQCQFSPTMSEDEKDKMTDFFYWEASENCQDIIEIDLRHFDGSDLKSMDMMFYYMFNLERIFLGRLDTSSVTDMSFAFTGVGSNVKGDSSSDYMKNWEESDAEPGFYINIALETLFSAI